LIRLGGEYHKFNAFFQRIGISHHVSCPYAHQQNGSAERKYCHIVEVSLSLLAHASMPLKYWDESFLAATYLINSLHTKILDFFISSSASLWRKTKLQWPVHVGRICVPSIATNSNSALNSVFFLDIATCIRGLSA
jgi:hypothetical protein